MPPWTMLAQPAVRSATRRAIKTLTNGKPAAIAVPGIAPPGVRDAFTVAPPLETKTGARLGP